jgi:hypothetical protein
MRKAAAHTMRFKVRRGRWSLLMALAVCLPTLAHEFWLRPESFFVPVNGTAALTLNVGENFTGERRGFSRALVARLRHITADTDEDLRDQLPSDGQLREFVLPLTTEGTHVFAVDTVPNRVVMPAGEFHTYLHEEGLDHVRRAREAAGAASTPGRERYRRHTKTLIQAGPRGDVTYARRTGQTIEIVPVADPLRAPVGEDLVFIVLFKGTPLGNALVKFWQHGALENPVVRAATTHEGKVTIALPRTGVWMASVVHMVPATDSAGDDWDSFWGNLTFELPSPNSSR